MKKVILTEAQVRFLVTEDGLARLLLESLNESINYEDLKRKIRRALAVGVSLAVIIPAINKLHAPEAVKDSLRQLAKTEVLDTTGFSQKVKEVEKYMSTALKNQGFSMNSTGLKPETLVMASIKKNFDLPFLMAAAHQESCFGATPRARRTNSVFSVGSYDNGKNTVTYDDPNDSVDDYIDLIQRSYLVNGKTLADLMTPGKFTNGIGKRFASDKGYENKIKSLRNRIIRAFPDLV